MTADLLRDPKSAAEALRRGLLDRAGAERCVAERTHLTSLAENPSLPADLVERLAVDPDEAVRLAVSVRPELDETRWPPSWTGPGFPPDRRAEPTCSHSKVRAAIHRRAVGIWVPRSAGAVRGAVELGHQLAVRGSGCLEVFFAFGELVAELGGLLFKVVDLPLEAEDAQAQRWFADTLAAARSFGEALTWYEKAWRQGEIQALKSAAESEYAAGRDFRRHSFCTAGTGAPGRARSCCSLRPLREKRPPSRVRRYGWDIDGAPAGEWAAPLPP
ncbi:hypothetical protein OG384_31765 [Streptomyces sp. NBC_01324]|uniref:hypothetical protein n=1 Tax=Streptomyces sp. NBC_01324 TaxID=2903826 RepID=UPI002E137932|nr:hypothetical protein OG384_31765 [Streptomyces sp. NBC_01324]